MDAPVVLVEYEDFRCPFCSKFATDVDPQLIERYVKPGVLRIERRDFPIFGQESVEMVVHASTEGQDVKVENYRNVGDTHSIRRMAG